MDDLAGAVKLAVAALRQMAGEAGIAPHKADTMAADLALHMMRLARRSVADATDAAPPHPRRLPQTLRRALRRE